MAIYTRRLDKSEFTLSVTNYDAFFDPNELLDGVLSPSTRWFDFGLPIGSGFSFLPETNTGANLGVWSDEASDQDGNFQVPLTIEFNFSSRTVSSVYLDFDEKGPVYATLMRVRYLDSLDNELWNQLVENSVSHFVYAPGSVDNVAKVVVEFLRVNLPYCKMRLSECDLGIIDIWSLMESPSRRLHSKVEIIYIKPFEEEIPTTVTSPDADPLTNVDQVSNGILTPDRRWFSFGAGPIDSGFSLYPDDASSYEVGWWSDEISDSNGTFDTPLTITLEYTSRITLSIQVIGDSLWDIYPVDFDVEAFNGVTSVYSKSITGNTEVNYIDNLEGSSFTSDKVVLTIHKINKPETKARIVEFALTVKDIFYDDTVLTIDYLEELYYYDGSIPIGAVSADEIIIKLRDFEKRFDIQNANSPVSSELKKNRRVKAWLGAERDTGAIDWYYLGTFYSYNWSIDRDAGMATVVARDFLELLRTSEYKRDIFVDTTVYDLFEDVLTDFGLTSEQYSISTAFQSITFPYMWYPKGSHRQALSLLAKNSLATVVVDRDDKIIIEDTQPTAEVKFEYKDSTNLFSRDYPLAWTDQTNEVQVVVNNYGEDTAKSVIDYGTVISIDAGQFEDLELIYSSEPIKNNITVTLTAGPNITYTIQNTYSWGCVLRLTNNGVSTETVTRIEISGVPIVSKSQSITIARDQDSIDDSGLFTTSFPGQFIQDLSYSNTIASAILSRFSLSSKDIRLDNRGHIALPPGSRIRVDDTEYMLLRQDLHYGGGLTSVVDAKIIE